MMFSAKSTWLAKTMCGVVQASIKQGVNSPEGSWKQALVLVMDTCIHVEFVTHTGQTYISDLYPAGIEIPTNR